LGPGAHSLSGVALPMLRGFVGAREFVTVRAVFEAVVVVS
jgi:hypothetical protein